MGLDFLFLTNSHHGKGTHIRSLKVLDGKGAKTKRRFGSM